METIRIHTSWGDLELKRSDDGLVRSLILPLLTATPTHPFGFITMPDGLPCPRRLIDLPTLFRPPPLPPGTAFQKAVWHVLRQIPVGQTQTYGQIAAATGHPGAARAVGTACGANPLPVFIPCHRATAIRSLGGFHCGLPWKTLLLAEERGRFNPRLSSAFNYETFGK